MKRILSKYHRHQPPLGELGRSRIDENKASLTETRSWIFMQEFLLNILGMYRVQFFTGYRVQGIKTVFYRVRVPNTGYLTN